MFVARLACTFDCCCCCYKRNIKLNNCLSKKNAHHSIAHRSQHCRHCAPRRPGAPCTHHTALHCTAPHRTTVMTTLRLTSDRSRPSGVHPRASRRPTAHRSRHPAPNDPPAAAAPPRLPFPLPSPPRPTCRSFNLWSRPRIIASGH
jgi:hypothetical protein